MIGKEILTGNGNNSIRRVYVFEAFPEATKKYGRAILQNVYVVTAL
jgi:hypothetical protein